MCAPGLEWWRASSVSSRSLLSWKRLGHRWTWCWWWCWWWSCKSLSRDWTAGEIVMLILEWGYNKLMVVVNAVKCGQISIVIGFLMHFLLIDANWKPLRSGPALSACSRLQGRKSPCTQSKGALIMAFYIQAFEPSLLTSYLSDPKENYKYICLFLHFDQMCGR